MASGGRRYDHGEAELEIEPLEGDQDDGSAHADPARVRRVLAVVRRRWRRVGAVVAILVVVGGAYAAGAVTGVRRIEREWLTAQELTRSYLDRLSEIRRRQAADGYVLEATADLEQVVRGLTRDYASRLDHHAGRARRVPAVDPAVRRLRVTVGRDLEAHADRLRAAADAAVFSFVSDPDVVPTTEAVAAARSRWRLQPGAPPNRVGFGDRLAGVASPPLTTRRTAVHLVADAGDAVIDIDVDGGRVEPVPGDAELDWVERDGWLAVTRDSTIHALSRDGGPSRPLGEGDDVVASSDRGKVWIEQLTDGDEQNSGFTAVEVDRQGRTGERVTGIGQLLWVTPTHLVMSRADGRAFGVVVVARDGGAVVARRSPAAFLAASGTRMAWSDPHGRLHLADLADLAPGGSGDRVVPGPADADAARASFSPDGRSLAVAWTTFGAEGASTRLAVHPVSGGEPASSTDLGTGVVEALAWSPRNDQVFAVIGNLRRIPMADGIVVLHVADGFSERLAIRGDFRRLAAF